MEFSTRKLRKLTLTGSSVFIVSLSSLESLAAEKSSSFERKQAAWSQLNYYSPTEGFHSKGSYGLHLGIGAIAPIPTQKDDSQEFSELEQPKARIFIGKGTPWPVDFGASLSVLEGKKSMQGGVHMQWTLFEGFQMPSIALRISHSMLSNYHEVKELTTDSAEFGFSYGIIRYVILSASVSEQWEKGKTQAKDEFLTLLETDLPEWKERRTVYSWGLNISPFTPFVQIGLEQSYWDQKIQVSLAKVSFLL
ncbi:MAG: hypothetical protein H7318_18355 [Oligoflexus sp.]|nr:hypothetical protein [Oligoflexus sp.]